MEKFGLQSASEYLQQANDGLVTIIQIETKEALQNVDAIAKVPGVDILFVGPFDLGNALGHPLLGDTMADELKEAIAKVLKTAKENEKSAGIYATSGEQARQFADQGFQMVRFTTRYMGLNSPIFVDICFGRYDRFAVIPDFSSIEGKGLIHALGIERSQGGGHRRNKDGGF